MALNDLLKFFCGQYHSPFHFLGLVGPNVNGTAHKRTLEDHQLKSAILKKMAEFLRAILRLVAGVNWCT